MKYNWSYRRIGDFVRPSENNVEVKPYEIYPLLGMSLEGRGLFLRERKEGIEIGAKTLNQVVPGDFIYSRLFAWKGAFDFVREEFEGAFVSDEYPTFIVNDKEADVKFLYYYFRQPKIWRIVEEYCIGVTKASRNRFKEKFFLDLSIPLPPLPQQKQIVSAVDDLKNKIEEIKVVRAEQEKELKNFAYSKYVDLIEDAEWRPMSEVAPIIRREVIVDESAAYPELGIRSFGKGTFHKPSLSGLDVGTKTIYEIKTGDLMFSNVFAWEGEIAVAKPEDNDRYGSHRFISCLVDRDIAAAEFLCFHFLMPKGLEDINRASPGGAGRNKTLGLEKLMRINIPLPDITRQEEFVVLLNKLNELRLKQEQKEQELNQILPTVLDKTFKGDL